MPDEYDDPTFDSLGLRALDQVSSRYSNSASSFPQQPIPQKKLRAGFNAIIVNARQKGNPVLSGVKNVPWEYGDIQPDFVLGATTCALFLSLKYHRLHPEYIYTRMQNLGKSFDLRVMLVLCDIDNHTDSLRELAKTCIVNNYALIVSWSAAEAGRYLESYKSLESAPADQIKEKVSTSYSDQIVDALTSIRAINKNDAYSLIGTFGSLKKAFNATPEELSSIGGWGPQKIKNFMAAVNNPLATKTGTSKRKQDEILSQSIMAQKSHFNGDFGPGQDHSASAAESGNPGGIEADLNQVVEDVAPPPLEIGTGAGEDGLEKGLAQSEAAQADTTRKRKANPEYEGVLASLAKMRKDSGYQDSS